jgi:hypothetical protein
MSDKATVYNDAAEKAILGCFLVDTETFQRFGNQLVEGDFFHPAHKRIFAGICRLADRGENIRIESLIPLIEETDSGAIAEGMRTCVPPRVSCDVDAVRKYSAARKRLSDLDAERFAILSDPSGASVSAPAFLTPKDWTQASESPMEEPPQLVAGLLHRGSKLVLGGSSKSNKTWSLLDLAMSVAAGSKWWGFDTIAGRVLYVDFELQEWAFRRRVEVIADKRGMKMQPGRFQFLNLRGRKVSIREIAKHVPNDLSLIVLDPIYKVMAGLDENKAGDIGIIMGEIEALAIESGAAVAFGAHYSKGNQAAKDSIDRISGSGVFARDPDAILSLTRHEEDDCFTVEPTLRNFAPVDPFVVRWHFPVMERDGDLDPARLRQAGGRPAQHNENELLALVQKPVSGQEWERLALDAGIGRSTYFNLRRQLVASGKIVNTDGSKLWRRTDVVQ